MKMLHTSYIPFAHPNERRLKSEITIFALHLKMAVSSQSSSATEKLLFKYLELFIKVLLSEK